MCPIADLLTSQALHNIFEPVFRHIDELVAKQVMQVRLKRMKDKNPNGYDIKVCVFATTRAVPEYILTFTVLQAIFLVGGFGSSEYLRESISHAHLDVQVIQPNDA